MQLFALKTEANIMMPLSFPCPICKVELDNPKELQEHRMRNHKNVLSEVSLKSRLK